VKRNLSVWITALALLAALTPPPQLSAQQPHYKLIDMDTLGLRATSILVPMISASILRFPTIKAR